MQNTESALAGLSISGNNDWGNLGDQKPELWTAHVEGLKANTGDVFYFFNEHPELPNIQEVEIEDIVLPPGARDNEYAPVQMILRSKDAALRALGFNMQLFDKKEIHVTVDGLAASADDNAPVAEAQGQQQQQEPEPVAEPAPEPPQESESEPQQQQFQEPYQEQHQEQYQEQSHAPRDEPPRDRGYDDRGGRGGYNENYQRGDRSGGSGYNRRDNRGGEYERRQGGGGGGSYGGRRDDRDGAYGGGGRDDRRGGYGSGYGRRNDDRGDGGYGRRDGGGSGGGYSAMRGSAFDRRSGPQDETLDMSAEDLARAAQGRKRLVLKKRSTPAGGAAPRPVASSGGSSSIFGEAKPREINLSKKQQNQPNQPNRPAPAVGGPQKPQQGNQQHIMRGGGRGKNLPQVEKKAAPIQNENLFDVLDQ